MRSRQQHICSNQPSMSEVAVSRMCNVNPTHRICRNELNSDGLCLDIALVPEDVYVVTAGIDKPHARFVHMRLAVGIVPLIIRHRSGRDDDQAMPGVRVPTRASAE